MATLKGIDVSKHQGIINWTKVKPNIDFAIVRAGYGKYISQKDSKFDANMKGISTNKIPYGFYWYSYATTVKDAEKEAEICLQVIKGTKPGYPVFFDQEYEKSILALSTRTRTDICLAFLKKIAEAGYKPGIYCSWDWLINKLDQSRLKDYPKWIAHYSKTCGYKGDDLAIWQYSSTGRVPGISGNVDMNYCYKNFISSSIKTGFWKKEGTKWKYIYTDGGFVKNDWLKVDNRWYYFDNDGYCVKGYHTINSKNYYFAEQYAFNDYIKECQLIITDKDGAIV